MLKNIKLDINLKRNLVDALIGERCPAKIITPELVEEKDIRKHEAYNRFRDLEMKNNYRKNLLLKIFTACKQLYDEETASALIKSFKELANDMDKHGAVIFANMIDKKNFEKLVHTYTDRLTSDGSKSWIHSYINLGNHPDMLSNPSFNDALVHPLLITLISYAAGGAIRMVDARGKDAEPLAVQAQDNMLHIDNTPFRKEFKIIVTWERGKASGPKGQNFVFIPGTHKGVRNCMLSSAGAPWSTEDGSIFTTVDAVQSVFNMQEKILGKSPAVVEATDPDRPLTTVFEAGALVHHRYRTKEKNVPRSCVIMAFHRALDTPGQFLSPEHLNKIAPAGSLLHFLMGKASDNLDDSFINAITANIVSIKDKISELSSANNKHTKILSYSTKILNKDELETWKKTVTAAPTVEQIKIQKGYFSLGTYLTHDLLTEMMKFDKHGPLDLILYADGHEEIRKWARNRIREMPISRLENRLMKFNEWELFNHPSESQLLSLTELQEAANRLVQFIDGLSESEKSAVCLDQNEKISSLDAFRSVRQILDDLGEAIVRCTSRQTFLSTSLFLLLANDELIRLIGGYDKKPEGVLFSTIQSLLANYLTTYVIIEKQIEYEKSAVNANDDHSKKSLYKNSLFFTPHEQNKKSDPTHAGCIETRDRKRNNIVG